MRKALAVIGLLLALVAPCRAAERFTPIVDEAIGSVARIECTYIIVDTTTQESHEAVSWGAGVVISTNGHIMTCQHVVEGTPIMIDVQFPGDLSKHFPAIVLRRSFSHDLALLKIATVTVPIPLAKVMARPGDEVIVIGNPYELQWSVTKGIVSGLHRDNLIADVMQIDAAVNPGNSGGPVLNMSGEVVGLVDSLRGGNNLGFAIPTSAIWDFLDVFKGLEGVQ